MLHRRMPRGRKFLLNAAGVMCKEIALALSGLGGGESAIPEGPLLPEEPHIVQIFRQERTPGGLLPGEGGENQKQHCVLEENGTVRGD